MAHSEILFDIIALGNLKFLTQQANLAFVLLSFLYETGGSWGGGHFGPRAIV